MLKGKVVLKPSYYYCFPKTGLMAEDQQGRGSSQAAQGAGEW